MAKVDGFHVQFTHRGSWKADLLAPGKEAEVIPVTWTKDWHRDEGTVFVWLKKPEEVEDYASRITGFKIAVAIKEGGSASSNNIIGIFWVDPIAPSDDPRGVLCKMKKRLKPADV